MDDTQHPAAPPIAPDPPHAAGRATVGWALADDRRLRAWLWLATCVLAVLLLAVSVPLAATLYGVHLLAAFATSLALSAAIPLAVRFHWVAAALATAGILAFAVLSAPSDGAPWPWPVTTIIGQFALLLVLGLMRVSWAGMFGVWLAGVVVTVPFAFVDVGAAANEIAAAAITAVALPIALLITQRRVVTAELFRERAHSASEQERRVLVEERNRIARELHDVVAHGLSIIHVQATSAPYRVEGLSDEAKAEFAEIAASARSAMTEMRQLLGVLRSAEAAPETTPQPGLGELAALAASVDRAGVPVTLELGEHLPQDGLASTAAYRIVQEALSNVVRHAPGATAHVGVEVLAGDLVVSVENDPAPGPPDAAGSDASGSDAAAPDSVGSGHGLVGIGERATLLGGRAEHGSLPGGGYRVLATLPLGADGGTA
ncbi:signal transduction histidine kinase [Agromyces sp. 3263]|uniref:sensor histidine kinase n=1 Tax=Agromyces sp. 3263 TaxID=2817750 RepID=UPI00285B6BFC|nr:sensor histidine kinase [Agromyces sp. 3263]MDR6906263.1 signal transduction histidine kinase [Agromyces sp. 3263]